MSIDKLRYRLKILFPSVLCLVMVAGCNNSYEQHIADIDKASFISVHTTVDSKAGEGEKERAKLLFWDEETFHTKWIENIEANPWFTSVLDDEIDYYRKETGIAFNTNKEYPTGEDVTIHATGYFPAEALTPQGGNYSKLMIAKGYDTGMIDFMTCDGRKEHSASRAHPFTDSGKELNFRHLMACIRFLGERDVSMENIVGVKNIIITVYNDNNLFLPTMFNLHTENNENQAEDKSTYIIGGYKPAPQEISIKYPDKITMGAAIKLGACYIVSPDLNFINPLGNDYVDPFGENTYVPSDSNSKPNLRIKVTADFYSISGGETASTTETWNIEISENMWESCHTGNKFIPGYVYDVLLHFNRSGVTVKAEAVPWDEGGIHVHPIQPITNP